jgi:hypothetical protein
MLLKRMKTKPQIIQGMTFPDLMRVLARNSFQVDNECFGRLGYLLILGIFNSIYGGCERFFNTRDIENARIVASPIFVLGHWRSGTTHLHNLFSVDPNVACPTAYQALFPHHFVFSQAGGALFNALAPEKRPMDNVRFSAGAPHEDEFALAGHSLVSPYMRVLFPRTEQNGHCALDPTALAPAALERWKKSFRLFLQKLTLSEGKRIVFKSPPHTGRVSLLLELFPDAKFVHIVRDPYTVYASTQRLWAKSLAYAHLQIPSPELVDEIILSWHNELFNRGLIPEGSLYEMKFEDLEARPEEIMEQTYSSLGIGDFETVRPRLLNYLTSIKGYEKNHHNLSAADCEKVRTHWRASFERYGYTV